MAKTIKRRKRKIPQKPLNTKRLTLKQINDREYERIMRLYTIIGEADQS